MLPGLAHGLTHSNTEASCPWVVSGLSELDEEQRWWLGGGGPLNISSDTVFLPPQESHVPLHCRLEGNTGRLPQETKGGGHRAPLCTDWWS